MRLAIAACSLLPTLAMALPSDVPLPPVRPAALREQPVARPKREMQGPPMPAPKPASQTPAAAQAPAAAPPASQPPPAAAQAPAPPVADPQEIAVCDRLLASGKVKAERATPIAGPEGCAIPAPVRMAAILDARGIPIALEPPVVVRCSFADGFADWVRQDLAPLLAAQGGGLRKLSGTNGYECRGRNRVVGAKLSEHAAGNAIDIRNFVLSDKTIADITKTSENKTIFAQIKLTACVRFMTVLGPGSDGYHEDNLHLDLQSRRNGARFCHWDLPHG